MSWDGRDRQRCEVSTTAVESLLRTLDEAAEWEHRTASRVRSFARPRTRLSLVAEDGTRHDDVDPVHERRAI